MKFDQPQKRSLRWVERLRGSIFLVCAGLMSACATAPHSAPVPFAPLAITQTRPEINLTFDKNVELAALLMMLAERAGDSTHPIAITAAERFTSFKDHPAVQETAEIYDHVGIDGILRIIWHHAQSDKTGMRDWPDDLIERISPDNPEKVRRRLSTYLNQVDDFRTVTNFDEFLKDHQNIYELGIDQLTELKASTNQLENLQSYFNKSPAAYRMTLSLLLQTGANIGFASSSPLEKAELIFITAPYFPVNDADLEAGHIGFSNPKLEVDRPGFIKTATQIMSLHEYGHGFITPALNKVGTREAIMKTRQKYASIQSAMERQGYHDWWAAFNEHAVRSAEIRIAITNGDADRAVLLRQRYHDMLSFTYLNAFEQAWAEYETYGPTGSGEYSDFPSFADRYIQTVNKLLNSE